MTKEKKFNVRNWIFRKTRRTWFSHILLSSRDPSLSLSWSSQTSLSNPGSLPWLGPVLAEPERAMRGFNSWRCDGHRQNIWTIRHQVLSHLTIGEDAIWKYLNVGHFFFQPFGQGLSCRGRWRGDFRRWIAQPRNGSRGRRCHRHRLRLLNLPDKNKRITKKLQGN